MKATEFTLKKRPYSDDQAKTLLAKVMDAETSDWHYNVHHKGYVDKLNEIEKSLLDADPAKANGNYSVFGELKRRWTWNHSGTILHDVYWECLGGDGDPSVGVDIHEQIQRDFGSFEEWKTDFKATALAAKLSGWGLLVFDTLGSGQLKNVLVDEHHYGAVWGAVPLVACDVFEHAYYHKDGPKRGAYIDNFINGIHWGRVNERFLKYIAR
jgi:superoxide dismutase, Fe-Mn family